MENTESVKIQTDKAVVKKFLEQPAITEATEFVESLDFSTEYQTLKQYKSDEGGMAKAWLSRHGESWVFATGVERWYFWTGKYWKIDDERNAEKDMISFLTTVNTIAGDAIKQAKTSGNVIEEEIADGYYALSKVTASRITNILEIAKSLKSRSITTVNQGNFLNLNNGTLDLDTFALREHRPDDFIDYVMPFDYDPSALCPTWDYFINSSLVNKPPEDDDFTAWQPDKSMALLLEEVLGVCLTNETRYEKMLFLKGGGGNGKSTIVHVLTELVKPFSVGVDFDSLGQSGNYDLAKLPGKRVAFATESEPNSKLCEKWLKTLVSTRPNIAARPIHGKPFDFESQVKIVWAMNDAPRVMSTNDAVWRRLILMPLYRTFEGKDKDDNLWIKLGGELSGILNRLLAGIRRVKTQGFTKCATCEDAKLEYKADSSSVFKWKNECCKEEKFPALGQFGHSLYEHYQSWCEEGKRMPVGGTKFYKELKGLVAHKRYESGVKYALNVRDNSMDLYAKPIVNEGLETEIIASWSEALEEMES